MNKFWFWAIFIFDLLLLIAIASFAGMVNIAKFATAYLIFIFTTGIIMRLFGMMKYEEWEKQRSDKVRWGRGAAIIIFLVAGMLFSKWYPYSSGAISASIVVFYLNYFMGDTLLFIDDYRQAAENVIAGWIDTRLLRK